MAGGGGQTSWLASLQTFNGHNMFRLFVLLQSFLLFVLPPNVFLQTPEHVTCRAVFMGCRLKLFHCRKRLRRSL